MATKPKRTTTKKTLATTAPDTQVVTSVKGFNPDLTCQGFQFEVGKTYTIEGEIEACKRGFHACEHPLDVFQYYAPGTSVFHEVKQSGSLSRHSADTKIASATITIGVQLSIGDLVKRAIDYVFARSIPEGETATGVRGAASATGVRGAASATGESGAASATGEMGAASATGERGAASATGWSGVASATGWSGAASATGVRGAASATGERGAASATGWSGVASATGVRGAASATGVRGAASATGVRGAASATGEHSVALGAGRGSKAMAGETGAICLVYRGDDGEIIAIRASKVGENGAEPNTWYSLNENGEFVKVEG